MIDKVNIHKYQIRIKKKKKTIWQSIYIYANGKKLGMDISIAKAKYYTPCYVYKFRKNIKDDNYQDIKPILDENIHNAASLILPHDNETNMLKEQYHKTKSIRETYI